MCPSSKNYVRNYKQEAKYHATDEQKKKRASRNSARRKAIKAGKASKGDGKDVHHRDGNAKNNSPSNLSVKKKSSNRSFKRNKKAGKR